MPYNKKKKKRKKSIATPINANKQTKQPESSPNKPSTVDQQPQQPVPMVPTEDDEKWARFYENDANTALQNGYTKAHYDAYLAKGGRSRLNAAPTSAPPAPAAVNNDEQWAQFYLKDPAKATASGYTKAHYDAYLAKKGAGAPEFVGVHPANRMGVMLDALHCQELLQTCFSRASQCPRR